MRKVEIKYFKLQFPLLFKNLFSFWGSPGRFTYPYLPKYCFGTKQMVNWLLGNAKSSRMRGWWFKPHVQLKLFSPFFQNGINEKTIPRKQMWKMFSQSVNKDISWLAREIIVSTSFSPFPPFSTPKVAPEPCLTHTRLAEKKLNLSKNKCQ